MVITSFLIVPDNEEKEIMIFVTESEKSVMSCYGYRLSEMAEEKIYSDYPHCTILLIDGHDCGEHI